jgi:hypothetical protein
MESNGFHCNFEMMHPQFHDASKSLLSSLGQERGETSVGPVANCVKNVGGASPRHEAIRSSGKVNDLIRRLFGEEAEPSSFRMTIWPEASSARNKHGLHLGAGSTVCVLIRRLNSSCSRSIADSDEGARL